MYFWDFGAERVDGFLAGVKISQINTFSVFPRFRYPSLISSPIFLEKKTLFSRRVGTGYLSVPSVLPHRGRSQVGFSAIEGLSVFVVNRGGIRVSMDKPMKIDLHWLSIYVGTSFGVPKIPPLHEDCVPTITGAFICILQVNAGKFILREFDISDRRSNNVDNRSGHGFLRNRIYGWLSLQGLIQPCLNFSMRGF